MNDAKDTVRGIEALSRRVREELKWLEFPAKPWVPERKHNGQKVYDVVVIGGGMAGLTTSGTLKRYGVLNHVVYDMAPKDREGPWVTYARMDTLRSPKTLTGPCLGIPVLTFRAWYEHRFGVQAWDALGLIPRPMWMEYLIWFREVLELPVENDVRVQKIDTSGQGLLKLTILRNGEAEEVLTRKVVLATGRDGLGGAYMPDVIRALPEHLRAHSADKIDFAALKGKRVVVIGAGASAMDNAATALEQGAARVDVLIRRGDIPRINKFTGIGSQGVVQGFVNLPDDWKWRFLDATLSAQTPPPRPSVLRVSQHSNAFFHLNCQIEEISVYEDVLNLSTSRGGLKTDFIIAATGFNVDLANRPELQIFADRIRFWRDRFVPSPDNRRNGIINSELANSPDLGPAFEFLPKADVICPDLHNIHCFCFPATLSHGKVSGDIPAISDGADRLVKGIVSHFFTEDCAIHFRNLEDFETPELVGDEWEDTPLS